jgi:hypothetical protein
MSGAFNFSGGGDYEPPVVLSTSPAFGDYERVHATAALTEAGLDRLARGALALEVWGAPLEPVTLSLAQVGASPSFLTFLNYFLTISPHFLTFLNYFLTISPYATLWCAPPPPPRTLRRWRLPRPRLPRLKRRRRRRGRGRGRGRGREEGRAPRRVTPTLSPPQRRAAWTKSPPPAPLPLRPRVTTAPLRGPTPPRLRSPSCRLRWTRWGECLPIVYPVHKLNPVDP